LNGNEGKAIEQAAEQFYTARAEGIDALRLESTRQVLHNTLYLTVGYAAYHAVRAITEEIKAHESLISTYKDFSSTALISACKRYPFGTLCVTYWVGDGAAAIYSKTKGVTLLGEVDSGEYSGQTRFLDNNEVSQEAILRRTRFELVDDVTAFIMMTDGVSDPKFETDSKLARASVWDKFWSDLDSSVGLTNNDEGKAQKLLSWLDFWSAGNHDDRTITIIY
jgi:hypothetical protein